MPPGPTGRDRAARPGGRAGDKKLWRAARVPLGFCVTGALPLRVRAGGWCIGRRAWPAKPLRSSAASLGVLRRSRSPLRCPHTAAPCAGRGARAGGGRGLVYRMSFLLLDSVRRAPGLAGRAGLGLTTRAAGAGVRWAGWAPPRSYAGPSTGRRRSRPGWRGAVTTAPCGSWCPRPGSRSASPRRASRCCARWPPSPTYWKGREPAVLSLRGASVWRIRRPARVPTDSTSTSARGGRSPCWAATAVARRR
ncbi:hypothetical protein SFUMM280S_09977 [Streptomyces fumanus]